MNPVTGHLKRQTARPQASCGRGLGLETRQSTGPPPLPHPAPSGDSRACPSLCRRGSCRLGSEVCMAAGQPEAPASGNEGPDSPPQTRALRDLQQTQDRTVHSPSAAPTERQSQGQGDWVLGSQKLRCCVSLCPHPAVCPVLMLHQEASQGHRLKYRRRQQGESCGWFCPAVTGRCLCRCACRHVAVSGRLTLQPPRPRAGHGSRS